jgi:hypothetical protein
MAVRDWSYVYGLVRRGMSPRTFELDNRPLGTDKVFLCRPCEWFVLQRRLRQLVPQHPFLFFGALGAIAGLLTGAAGVDRLTELALLVVVVAWVAFTWGLRRRKSMCNAIFLHLRRKNLAEAHGVKPKEIQPYLDVAVQ